MTKTAFIIKPQPVPTEQSHPIADYLDLRRFIREQYTLDETQAERIALIAFDKYTLEDQSYGPAFAYRVKERMREAIRILSNLVERID